jgi:hypothetical protein
VLVEGGIVGLGVVETLEDFGSKKDGQRPASWLRPVSALVFAPQGQVIKGETMPLHLVGLSRRHERHAPFKALEPGTTFRPRLQELMERAGVDLKREDPVGSDRRGKYRGHGDSPGSLGFDSVESTRRESPP